MRDFPPKRGVATTILVLATLMLLSSPLVGGEIRYQRDIKPLLAEKCVACHGPVKQEAGLRLDAAALIREGSETGKVVVPGQPDKSALIERISSESDFLRMPPVDEGEPLDDEEIAHVKTWIAAGMPAPENEVILQGPGDHWAYQPIERPRLPKVSGDSQAISTNPIDRILNAAAREKGLVPLPRARPEILLRRVTMDLVGLPPTLDEQDAYLADGSPDRYSKLVDRLLADPTHGERWGRHWMDIWRYSDWDGYKKAVRGSQKHIWHWRNWIIESINADKGYDRMIVEMLAGDEIAPLDDDVLRATGYLARNYHASNRNIWLDATVEHTAKAFLGMTLNCARCHDHKYDPIAQTNYYQFRAIFEPHNVRMDRIPGQPDVGKNGLPRAFDAKLDTPTYLYKRGDERRPDKENPLSPGVVELFGLPFDPEPVELPALASAPSLAESVITENRAALARKRDAAAKKAAAQQRQTVSTGSDGPVMAIRPTFEARRARLELRVANAALASFDARVAADRAKWGLSNGNAERLAKAATQAEQTHTYAVAELALLKTVQALRHARESDEKDKAKKDDAIEKARKAREKADKELAKARRALASEKVGYSSVGKQYPKTSTGRRLALARWITHERNPLTARVAINHIWMRHFGDPLVENVYDFGLQSDQPLHAGLLDWLAAELIENDWSMKHIHRLIVTSQAYQRTSSLTGDLAARNLRIDAENDYRWHAKARRLEAEIVRDSTIAVADELVSHRGSDIDFTRGDEVHVRSLYFRHAYEKQMTMLKVFDAASPNECYRRKSSILPQQALALANGRLGFDMSRALAQRLSARVGPSPGSDSAYIDVLFRATLCREPREAEQTACHAFLRERVSSYTGTKQASSEDEDGTQFVSLSDDPSQRAREQLAHVLLNHNDFITVR